MARAKRKPKKTSRYNKTRLVPQSGTRPRVRLPLRDPQRSPTLTRVQRQLTKVMAEVEDHRRPKIIRYPRTIFGTRAKVVPTKIHGQKGPAFKFKHPWITIECLKRKLRRRSLFANPKVAHRIRTRGNGIARKKRKEPKYKGIRCR